MYKFIFYFLFSLCLVPLATYAEETLAWQDCVKEAAKNNPDLISAVENVSQQKAAKSITASTLFPQVSANLDASTAKTTTTSSSTGKTTKTIADSYSYGLTGSQLIFDGFTTINNVNAASENIKAARENYRFTSTQVRLNLRTAFVNLLTAQQMVFVSEEIVKIRRDNLMLITLRYQSGLEHKGALLKAEADLAQARFQLSQAKRDIELAETQLNQQMGRREFKPVFAKGDFTVVTDTKEKPDFDTLIKDNPSVLQAIAKKNSAEFSIKSVYGSFLPQITGNAATDKSQGRFPPHNDQWNLGLSVNLPIFEGGLRLAQLNQAQAVYNQALANEKSIRNTAIVNLEQTWVNLKDAMETVSVQAKTLEASQERSKIAQAQYSTGFISFDNWIIIEDDLVRAKTAFLQAQGNALLAEANWIQAKGEMLEYAQQKN
jgi:TolC family type I secretion outer membrane protein